MMKRSSPIEPRVSDFIVRAVMDDEKLLIKGATARLMQSNHLRKEVWEKISDRIFAKFKVRLSATQIQNHFNNRKKRVLTLGKQERKYRTTTGGGVSPEKEYAFNRLELNDEDLRIHDYFVDKVANKGLKNADTMEIAQGRGKMEKDYNMVFNVDDCEDGEVFNVDDCEDGEILESGESNIVDEHTIDEEILSDHSAEELCMDVNHHNVSAAQLRRMEAQRIKYQTKCFDAWSRQAAVQTAALQETIRMMKNVTDVFTSFLEKNTSMKNDGNNHDTYRDRTRESCDPNIEGSVKTYSISS